MTSVRKPRRRRARSAAEKIYRKKPVQARSQTTVDGILSAAAEILARTGYDPEGMARFFERLNRLLLCREVTPRD